MQNYSNTDWVSFQEVVTNLVFSLMHVHLCVCVCECGRHFSQRDQYWDWAWSQQGNICVAAVCFLLRAVPV